MPKWRHRYLLGNNSKLVILGYRIRVLTIRGKDGTVDKKVDDKMTASGK